MKKRNTKERALEMAKKAVRRVAATGSTKMIGVPANINRHAGKPHEHARANARNLKNQVK